MQLNKDNYYERHPFLTSSKIRDYLRSSEYFQKKHILGGVDQKKSDALLEGKMLDTLLTEGEDAFEYSFRPVERRSLKNPPTGYTEVTQNMYDTCRQRAEKIRRTKDFEDLSSGKFKTQVILQKEMPNFGKNFIGIAGMLDFLQVDVEKGFAIIVDLKTSSTADPRKYYWHALDYGYDLQMAWYGWLVHEVYGINYDSIEYAHLVLEKDVDGINKVATFVFDRNFIAAKREMLHGLAERISSQGDFVDPPVTWEDASIVGGEPPSSRQEFSSEESLEILPS